ncbi:MAG: response regulator [Gammaproteobacteria bacterium]|nr:response regulator [Gammaproteobacteria bacterium]
MLEDAPAGWRPLILIVDDSPTHVAFVRQSLERWGCRVQVAATGRQALHLARELGPALILMDVIMPDLNGYQATRKLSRNTITEHIPVVLTSSKSAESDRVWGLRQGAQAYLVKPFSEEELIETVQETLERTAREAQAPVAAGTRQHVPA